MFKWSPLKFLTLLLLSHPCLCMHTATANLSPSIVRQCSCVVGVVGVYGTELNGDVGGVIKVKKRGNWDQESSLDEDSVKEMVNLGLTRRPQSCSIHSRHMVKVLGQNRNWVTSISPWSNWQRNQMLWWGIRCWRWRCRGGRERRCI